MLPIQKFSFAMRKSFAVLISVALFAGCGDSGSDEPAGPVKLASTPSSDSVDVSNNPSAKIADDPSASTSASMGGMGSMSKPDSANIVFKDDAQTNVEPPVGLDGLVFISTNGERVQMKDYAGKKNVVLVFTEGFAGMLCPFCKTQTARLVGNYEKFQALDTEILVVFPGERDHVEEFIEAARTTDKGQVDRVPFPIVLDQKLEAVDYFNIRSRLAHPSTYIVDKQGKVQFAYVGDDMSADRPSIKAILRTIESIQNREKSSNE